MLPTRRSSRPALARVAAAFGAALLASCSAEAPPPAPAATPPVPAPSVVADAPSPAPADAFLDALRSICGQAFAGRVLSTDPADADFANAALVMHVRECGDTEVRVPFHVGEDRSRTWVFTRTESGLRLKHDHRHKDGSSDVLTMYGGDTADAGTATRQAFPADAESKELFTREGRAVSNDNIWAVEIEPGVRYVYELTRPNRLFRVEFDLSQPVEAPPPPWGATEADGTVQTK